MPRSLQHGLTLCAATVLVAACSDPPPPEQSHFYALGTRVVVSSHHDIASVTDPVETLTRQWEQDFDPWGSGALAELNSALSQTGKGQVPDRLEPSLDSTLTLARESQGLFHPGMGELIRAWGFHRQPMPLRWQPPGATQLATLIAEQPATSDLNLEDGTLSATGQPFRLELGGVAKGLLLDEIKTSLAPDWPEGALINLGGDVLAIGKRDTARGRPWRVGILDPRGDGVLASLDMQAGECAMTSGDYERQQEFDGHLYHHLLDPRTGQPARGSASVTVVDKDCARADAAATALFVAGPERWPDSAARLSVQQVMLVSDEGEVELTPSMAKRLSFPNRQPTLIERELQ